MLSIYLVEFNSDDGGNGYHSIIGACKSIKRAQKVCLDYIKGLKPTERKKWKQVTDLRFSNGSPILEEYLEIVPCALLE